MLKICSFAAAALVAGAGLAAAQGPESKPGGAQGGPRGGGGAAQQAPAPRMSPPPQRMAPPQAAPQPRAQAPQRAPQSAPPRAYRADQEQQRRAMEQRRATGQRAAEQQQRARAAEQQQRARAAEQQRSRAAEQQRSRAAEQQRGNERRQAEERQRAERQRAAEPRRGPDGRDRPGQVGQPDMRQGATRTARYDQVRQERTKLSVDQRARLRQAFPTGRDRVSRVHFTRRVGTRIPRSVALFAVPAAVFAIFPYYRDYRYTVIDDSICIVDPATYEIVDVLDEGAYPPAPLRPQVAELHLSPSERALVLDSISPDFPQVPLQLRMALGAEIPEGVELHEFAPLVVDRVQRLREFRFLVAQDQLVIVAPDRSIALVLER
jgi:Protein of unknown function (DUF1236)